MFRFRLSERSNAVDQRNRLGEFSRRSSDIADFSMTELYPIFETFGARIATALKKINPELESQEENLLGRAEGSKAGLVPSWQADSLHDLRVLSGHGHPRVHPRFFRSGECNFYVEMMAKVLIRDGMKFSYRKKKCLKITFWRVSTR